MWRHWIQRGVVACAAAVLTLGSTPAWAADEAAAAPVVLLRHAVACPPFKGEAALASLYQAEMVKMLRSTEGVEYLEGPHALRNAPEFIYRVDGAIVTNEEGQAFVTVTLTDDARKERIASLVAPASADPAAIEAWKRTIQTDMTRRALKLPFECRVRRQAGQESVSLDRGLDSGLQPGMVLYVSMEEEPLISPATGEIIGRDSPRAVGQIQIFRVMENTAYARPVLDTKLPLFARLYARTF
jgi:hypothetical protein